jgi:translocation and assembly module TamA
MTGRGGRHPSSCFSLCRWLLWLALLSAGCAHAQTAAARPPSPTATPSTPAAFALQIDGPKDVTAWLLQHLELQRYKDLTDLDETELQRLLQSADEQARELLATLGYFSPTLQWQTQPGTLDQPTRQVLLSVAPGMPSVVSEVRITLQGEIEHHPATQAQKQALTQQWLLPAGKAFTQSDWSQAKSAALRRLTADNYPLARLVNSQALVDPDSRTARLSLTLDSGPRVLLGQAHVTGSERYGQEQAVRLARIKTGQPYRQSDLLEAQQRLVASGFYDSVFVTLDTEGEAQAMPVKIDLKEALRQKWVVGLGVRSDNGPRVSAEYTQHRVPGLDWRAVTKVAVDKTLQTLSLDLLGQPNEQLWRWTTSGKVEHQVFTGYEVSSQRLRAGRTQQADRVDRTYYAQYDTSHTMGSLSETRESLSAHYAWTWRRFDTLPFPSEGWGFGLEVGSGVTLGSQHTPYGRWLGRVLAMQPLWASGHKLSLRGELGGVVTRDASGIPTTQLFIAGGDGSVRGYALSGIGVTTSPGVISAGRYLATGSAEWQIPIYRQSQRTDWEGTVFVDAGAVADSPSQMRAKVGAGFGARWRSPVGPLQIDLAQAQDTHQWRLHMSVGFKF